MKSPSTAPHVDKVTFRDWLLAAIGLLFTIAGLLLVKRDLKLGATTIAIFGSCFFMAARAIFLKRKRQRQMLLTATVVGGQPILPSKFHNASLGIGLLAVGGVVAFLQFEGDKIFFGLAMLIAIAGAVVLVGLFTGLSSKAYIQFDPPGLTLGHRSGKTVVPWSAITRVARGEIHRNQAVFLWVDSEAFTDEPSPYREKQKKQMALSRSMVGADIVIMTSIYGVDASILLEAIKRYVTSPETRMELQSASALNG